MLGLALVGSLLNLAILMRVPSSSQSSGFAVAPKTAESTGKKVLAHFQEVCLGGTGKAEDRAAGSQWSLSRSQKKDQEPLV